MTNYRMLDSRHNGHRRLETWVTGSALLSDPMLNRGTAFTPQERQALNLVGLLPSAVTTPGAQAKRAYAQ